MIFKINIVQVCVCVYTNTYITYVYKRIHVEISIEILNVQ